MNESDKPQNGQSLKSNRAIESISRAEERVQDLQHTPEYAILVDALSNEKDPDKRRALLAKVTSYIPTQKASIYKETEQHLGTLSKLENITSGIASIAQESSTKNRSNIAFNGQMVVDPADSSKVIRSDGSERHLPAEYLERREQFYTRQAQDAGLLAQKNLEQGRAQNPANYVPGAEVYGPASRMASSMEEAAYYRAGQGVIRKQGLTELQRQESAGEIFQRYQRREEEQNLTKTVSQEIKSGSLNIEDEKNKLKTLMEAMNSATAEYVKLAGELNDVTDESIRKKKEEDVKSAGAKEEQARKDAAAQQARVEEAERQGGGDGGQKYEAYRQNLGAVRQVVAGFENVMIGQSIHDVRQKGRAAQNMVDKFELGESALHGNMHSLLQVTGSRAADDFARNKRTTQQLFQGADVLAETADTSIKLARDAASVPSVILGTLTGDLPERAQQRIVDYGTTARRMIEKGGDIMNEMTPTETAQAAQAAGNALLRSQTAIPAKTLQRVYDQVMAAGGAVTGLGAGAASEFAALTDNNTLRKAANFGMTGTQFAGYAGMAAQLVGAGESASGIAMKAAEAESRNILSASQYIQNVGELSNVGGKSSDLHEIIKSATAAGMDNSKNIGQMVQATAALSQGLARSGVSDTTAVSDMIGAVTKQLVDSGVDKNLAIPMSTAAIGKQNEIFSSQDITGGNLIEAGMLEEGMSDVGELQRANIATLTQEELKVLQKRENGGFTAAGKRLLRVRGLSEDQINNKEFVSKFDKGALVDRAATAQYDFDVKGGALGITGRENQQAYAFNNLKTRDIAVAGIDAAMQLEVNKKEPTGSTTAANETKKIQAQYDANMREKAGDFNVAVDQIIEKFGQLKEELDPEKFQDKLNEAVLSKEILSPFTKAGEALNTSATHLNNVAKNLSTVMSKFALFATKEDLDKLNKNPTEYVKQMMKTNGKN